jgi:hypothetical protein
MKELGGEEAILELLRARYPGFPSDLYRWALSDGIRDSMF